MAETYRSIARVPADLGAPIRTHARRPRFGPAPFVLTSVGAALTWIATFSLSGNFVGAAWVTTALAVGSAAGWGSDVARRRRASAVTVCEHGLLLHRAGGDAVLAWDDVTSLQFVREKRLREQPLIFLPLPGLVVSSDPTEWHWVCRVRVGRDVVFEVSDGFESGERLVDALRSAIAKREVARVLDTILAGGRHVIGPFAFTEAHVEVRGHAIPWDAVAEVEIREASLVLVGERGDVLAGARVEDVPNAHAIGAILEAKRSTRDAG